MASPEKVENDLGERPPYPDENLGSSSISLESYANVEKAGLPARSNLLASILRFTKLWWNGLLQSGSQLERRNPQHLLRYVRNLFVRSILLLVPSFLRDGPLATADLHETSYLDGLRGYASYAVFFSHHLAAFCNEVWHPFGQGNNFHFVQTNHFFQRPIIRMMYNGQAAIAVFYVLSGYVLSYKPLKLMHAHHTEKFQHTLSSMIFRRWGRLFFPVAALWIVNIFLAELGAFDWFTEYHKDHPSMPPGMIEQYLARGDTVSSTVYNAISSFLSFTRQSLWNWTTHGYVPVVDGHMWTLHVEFRSSCVLFLVLHGTSRMIPNLRLGFFIAAAFGCWVEGEWALATFLAGSAIADVDLRMRRKPIEEKSWPQYLARLRAPEPCTRFEASQNRALAWIEQNTDQLGWWIFFVFSLLLLSYPSTGAFKVSFYNMLLRLTPSTAQEEFFWLCLGATMLIFVCGRLRIVQKALETPFSQYIGKTSFALYLVHGSVIRTLGYYSVIQSWVYVTGYSGWGYAMGIVLPFLFAVWPVTIIVTDVFWRKVDIPTVSLGRWIEHLVIDKSL